MKDRSMISQDIQVQKMGGLSGLIGSILLILAMAFVAAFIGTETLEPLNRYVERFPSIHSARIIENLIYLTGLLFQIPLFLALFWILRKDSLAPALFGSVLGIVGLVPMIASATPHVGHFPLADIYHNSATSMEVQEAIAVMWQGTWGLFNAPLYIGFLVVPLAIVLLGIGMFRSPSFGRGLRWLSLVVGGVGTVSAVLQMVDPDSPVGAISYFAIIIFGLVAGISTVRFSKNSVNNSK